MVGGLRVDSVVTVMDPRQGRMVQFGLDGQHLVTRRVKNPKTPDGMEIPLGRVVTLRNEVTVGVTAGWYAMGRDAVSEPSNHVVLGFPGSGGSDTIASYHFGNARWRSASEMGIFNPGFGDGGDWVAVGDSVIVVADGATGELIMFIAETGRWDTVADIGAWFAVDTVHMGVSGRPVSRADKRRAETDLRGEDPDLPPQIDIDGWPEHWSVATNLLVADDGKVWAERVVYGDDRQHWTEVDLYGPERRQFLLPEGFRLRAIAIGRLYGAASDGFGVQRLGILRLR